MYHKDTTILSIYSSNNSASNYMKQTDRQKKNNRKSTSIVGDFKIPFSVISGKKMGKNWIKNSAKMLEEIPKQHYPPISSY